MACVHASRLPSASRRYVLAEFADEITEREPCDLADELVARYDSVPAATQALLLTALLKLRMAAVHDSRLHARAEAVFALASRAKDADLQQRAVEYLKMSQLGEGSVVMRDTVMAPMPDWPDATGVAVAAERGGSGGSAASSSGRVAAANGTSAQSIKAGGSTSAQSPKAASPRAAPAAAPRSGDATQRADAQDVADDAPGTPTLKRGPTQFTEQPPPSINLLDLSSPGEALPAASAAAAADAPSAAPAVQPSSHSSDITAHTAEPQRESTAASPLRTALDGVAGAAPAGSANISGSNAALLYGGKGVLLEDEWLQVRSVFAGAICTCGQRGLAVAVMQFWSPAPGFR